MKDWTYVAAIPPLLVWFVVYLYLAKIDGKLKKLKEPKP